MGGKTQTISVPMILIVGMLLLLPACSSPSANQESLSLLRRTFGAGSTIQAIPLPDSRPPPLLAAWVVDDKASPSGYGLHIQGRSRSGSFQTLVVLGADFAIRQVEVLSYQGERGGEIRQHSFLQQFQGLSADSELRLGKDIQAVTGATLSSRSMSAVIRESIRWLKARVLAESSAT